MAADQGSSGGSGWTAQPSFKAIFGTTLVNDVIWTGSFFIAVGGTKCATSPDGITWTNRPGFTSAFTGGVANAIGWNGSTLVVVGGQPKCVVTSADNGVTWTARTVSDSVFAQSLLGPSKILWTGSKFVVIGSGGAGNGTAQCMTSSDGITWSGSNLSSIAGVNNMGQGLAWNGSVLFYNGIENTGASCAGATSTNGVSWTLRTSFSSVTVNQMAGPAAWGNSKFVVSAPVSRIITSPDGITWTRQSNIPVSTYSNNMIWTGTKFVQVGNCYGNGFSTSPDGLTWTTSPTFDAAFGASKTAMAVAWNGSMYVVVGQNGVCVTSSSP